MAKKPKAQKRTYSDGSVAWLVQVSVKGFKRTSRTFPTRNEAIEWAEKHKRELKEHKQRGGQRPDVATLTIKQLIEEFLGDEETKALRYHGDLQMLLAWWVNHMGSERVLRTGVFLLRQARDKLRQGRAPATTNRYLSALRSCWNWGKVNGLIPEDRNWPKRLMLTEPKGRVRYLNDKELASVLEAAKSHSLTMHAAVVISLACGIRQSELRRLRWADVELDRQRITILESKNGESRSVFVPSSAVTVLRALKRSALVGQTVIADQKGQAVNKSWIEHKWRVIRDEAKLRDFRWHDLRHSCASYLAQAGASLVEVGAVLGHKSPSVTARYAHLVAGAAVTGHTKLDEKLRGPL